MNTAQTAAKPDNNQDYQQEVGQETRGNAGEHSCVKAGTKHEDKSQGASHAELLELILSQGNLNEAYLRVKQNGGSHGVDKMTVKEISDELGISVNTVENQMVTALKKLRVALKDYLPLLLFLVTLKRKMYLKLWS